jgi:hypothetical protein
VCARASLCAGSKGTKGKQLLAGLGRHVRGRGGRHWSWQGRSVPGVRQDGKQVLRQCTRRCRWLQYRKRSSVSRKYANHWATPELFAAPVAGQSSGDYEFGFVTRKINSPFRSFHTHTHTHTHLSPAQPVNHQAVWSELTDGITLSLRTGGSVFVSGNISMGR